MRRAKRSDDHGGKEFRAQTGKPAPLEPLGDGVGPVTIADNLPSLQDWFPCEDLVEKSVLVSVQRKSFAQEIGKALHDLARTNLLGRSSNEFHHCLANARIVLEQHVFLRPEMPKECSLADTGLGRDFGALHRREASLGEEF